MSRSKVPAGQPVGFPSQWQPQSESDGYSQEPQAPQQWPNQQFGAPQEPAHNPYINPDPRYPQPAPRSNPNGYAPNGAYQPPHEGQSLASYSGSQYQAAAQSAHAPPAPQRAYPQHAHPQHAHDPANYGSQFDPPGAPHHGYDRQPAPAAADYGLSARLAQAAPQDRQDGHYDQWSQGGREPDPRELRNYDLGSYHHDGQHGDGQHGHAHAEGSWGHGRDAYGLQSDPHRGGYSGQQNALEAIDPAGSILAHDQQEGLEGEVEERRRGTSKFVIVGALVGAIGLGGGLAYAYKTFMIPAGTDSPPVVKADKKPAKMQPAEPGGKQFANKDNKLLGRLGEDGDATAKVAVGPGSSAADDAAGARKVVTYPVGRDGSILPPATQAFPSAAPQQTTATVPGLVLSDGYGNRGPTAPVVTSSTPTSAPLPPPAQQGRAQVLARAQPAEPPAARAAPAAPAIEAAKKPLPPKQAVAAAPVAIAPAPAAAAAATKQGTNGFVAVLTSTKSRMDALKGFADLQQKYPGVLQDKTPDVVEADLSTRGLGTMYRAVVGPPGSREAANDICGRLKASGYTNCWVTSY